jgi:hypothetical protein
MMTAGVLALCLHRRTESSHHPACDHVPHSAHAAARLEHDKKIKWLKAALKVIRCRDWGWKGGGSDIRIPVEWQSGIRGTRALCRPAVGLAIRSEIRRRQICVGGIPVGGKGR